VKPRRPKVIKTIAFMRNKPCPVHKEDLLVPIEVHFGSELMVAVMGEPYCDECLPIEQWPECTDADVAWDQMLGLDELEWAEQQIKDTIDSIVEKHLKRSMYHKRRPK
jgi:hypothetical protein